MEETSGLYYKLMAIVNDDPRVVYKLEASLTDDTRVIIYDRHMFIVQATEQKLVANALAYLPKRQRWEKKLDIIDPRPTPLATVSGNAPSVDRRRRR